MPEFVVYGEPVRGRSCGSCTACCTQVPVDLPTGKKRANERCPMLRSSGCSIYAKRPLPCRAWSCRWLFDPDTAELARPDKSGVIIDPMPDEAVVGGEHVVQALQLWVDEKRPDAHRDPALRRYLERMAEQHRMHIIARWNSERGVALFPPAVTPDGNWLEVEQTFETAESMQVALAAARATQ